MKATIFDIERNSYVDGPGIRTTVFLKGCHMNCAWCHNPESRSGKIERMWYETKCSHCGKCAEKCAYNAITYNRQNGTLTFDKSKCVLCGKCALICPCDAISICGREAETDEIFTEIKKDISFYNISGGGMTVSGGECMLHADFTAELLRKCKTAGIHTAVDTAGDVPWESFETVLPYTDLFLYDIKCITPKLHLQYTGTDNTRIIENYMHLLSVSAKIHVRVPMIPDCSANDNEFAKIAEFLLKNRPAKVELLPYHAMGENKYRALGLGEPAMFNIPSEEDMIKYKRIVGELL